MKISLDWIKDFIDISGINLDVIESKLTDLGLESKIKNDDFTFSNDIVLGKIVDIKKHSNADKLNICLIDIGETIETEIVNKVDFGIFVKIFEEIDIGIEIISFETASYCTKREKITTNFKNQDYTKSKTEISATKIRRNLIENIKIPSYLLRKELYQIVMKEYQKDPENIFHK